MSTLFTWLTRVLLCGAMVACPGLAAFPEGIQEVSSEADFRRDPIRLIEALRAPKRGVSYETAFDSESATVEALGATQIAQLSRSQQAAVSRAFKKLVAQELDRWRNLTPGPFLQSEFSDGRASLVVMHGYDLVRVRLVARDGLWSIVEIEDLDRDIPLFADALRDALKPGTSRARILDEKTPFARALRQIEALIAADGEQPALLLQKALLVGSRQYDEAEDRMTEADYDQPVKLRGRNRGRELLGRLRARWPEYAPALFAYATEEFVLEEDRTAVVAALKHYTQLRPLDPRGWYWLGEEQKGQDVFDEAESAFKEAVRLAPADNWCVEGLFDFYLDRGELPKLLDLLKTAIGSLPEVEFLLFKLANRTNWFDEVYVGNLERVLLDRPDRLGKSRQGLRLLARAQIQLRKYEAGLDTVAKLLGIGAQAEDYVLVAELNRLLHRYEAAADAARQAIALDAKQATAFYQKHAIAYYHLACALAQLGKKQEALDALRRYENAPFLLRLSWDYRDEPDLQPLVELPEFKALTQKEDGVGVPLKSSKATGKTPGQKQRKKK